MGYIYIIENTANGKKYVGQTGDTKRRFDQHLKLLKANNHPCEKMQNDFNEYGEDCFKFTPVQYENSCEINMCECIWMAALKTYDPEYGYNYEDRYFHRYDGEPTERMKLINDGKPFSFKEFNFNYTETTEEEILMREIANRIKAIIDKKGITHKQFGEIIGKTESTANKKINGKIPIYVDEIEIFGNAVGLTDADKCWICGF